MDLYMRTEKGDSSHVGESTALTILAANYNKVFYYHGSLKEALQNGLFGFTNYSLHDGIGNIIRAKQAALDKIKLGYRKDLMILIKPADDSRYENIINILDEVLINEVPHYAILDINNEEKQAVSLKGGQKR